MPSAMSAMTRPSPALWRFDRPWRTPLSINTCAKRTSSPSVAVFTPITVVVNLPHLKEGTSARSAARDAGQRPRHDGAPPVRRPRCPVQGHYAVCVQVLSLHGETPTTPLRRGYFRSQRGVLSLTRPIPLLVDLPRKIRLPGEPVYRSLQRSTWPLRERRPRREDQHQVGGRAPPACRGAW